MNYFLGFDIGGTKCAVSLGHTEQTADGQTTLHLHTKDKFPTAAQPPMAVLEEFYTRAARLLDAEALQFSDLTAIGISCGGPLDSQKGLILSPPNLPGWDAIAVTRYFEERTGLRTFLQNDANACAAAEWKFGAGQGCENMIFLTFGTGLGAGLILNGRLYSGSSDMAGEIGHVRIAEESILPNRFLPTGYGKRGTAEGFCSGGGIAQLGRYAARMQLERDGSSPLYTAAHENFDAINAQLIAELARRQDTMCLAVYKECGVRLGETLSILIDLLNPSKIILGGIFMRAADLLIPSMETVIKRESLQYAREVCTILPAGLGETIGDYAALSVACTGIESINTPA